MTFNYKQTVEMLGQEKANQLFESHGISKGRVKMTDEEKYSKEYLKMTESAHAKIIHNRLVDMGIIHNHSPNEAGQSGSKNIIIMMAKKKSEGTSKGYPDLHVLIPYKDGSVNLYIELKKAPGKQGGWNGSSFHIEQAEWLNELNKVPLTWVSLCQGSEQAINLIEDMVSKLSNLGLEEIIKLWKEREIIDYKKLVTK